MSKPGCEKCWSTDPSAAWDKVTHTAIQTHLIDESHFIVSVRCCGSCSQHFLQVTTETIDWQDGEDPIYRTVIPISQAEKANLLAEKPLSEGAVATVGVGRSALRYDWPKGAEPSVYWGTGMRLLAHD